MTTPCRSRLLAAVAVAMLTAGTASAATLTVNATSDPGSVGDGTLSLSEAIRLATGDLSVTALSPAESAQVTGTPGSASADTILFSVTSIACVGAGAELLPPLSGGDDTIDGQGSVTLDASGASNILTGLRISSSHNTVQGLVFDSVPGTALLVQASAGGVLSGNAIVGNHFVRVGLDAIRLIGGFAANGATASGGTVDGTQITGNTIETAASSFGSAAMNLMAVYTVGGAGISGAQITNTTISGNTIRDVTEGVFVRTVVGNGPLSGNTIATLAIEDNLFERVRDSTILLGASSISGTGTSTDNVLRDVAVRRNTIRSLPSNPDPNQGGAVFLSAGILDSCFDTTGTPTSLRDVTSGIEISDNQVSDRGPYGVFVIAAHTCGGAGGSLTASVLEHVTVSGNTVDGCKTGISLQAASTVDTGKDVVNSGNTLRDVSVSGNTFSNSATVGIEFIGAFSGNSHGPTGQTTQNSIADVTIDGNTLTGNKYGMAVNGAIAQSPAQAVQGNVIHGPTVTNNQISGATSGAITINSVVAAGGKLTGNGIDGPVLQGNTLTSNKGIAVQLLPAVLLGGQASGNTVTGAIVKQNVIRDTTASPGVAIMLVGTAGNTLAPVQVDANTIDGVDKYGILITKTTRGHFVTNNHVADFGKRPFVGNKRRNKVTGNVFGPRRRRHR